MTILVGTTYQHFKGGLYTVTRLTRDSETLEMRVVYKPFAQHGPVDEELEWDRPAAMWLEPVIWEDGKTRPRFVEVTCV